MIRIANTYEHDRHLIHHPGHVDSKTEHGMPVDPGYSMVGRCLDVSHVHHKVIPFFELSYRIVHYFKAFFDINCHIEAFLCELIYKKALNPVIGLILTKDLKKDPLVLNRAYREKILSILNKCYTLIRTFSCPAVMFFAVKDFKSILVRYKSVFFLLSVKSKGSLGCQYPLDRFFESCIRQYTFFIALMHVFIVFIYISIKKKYVTAAFYSHRNGSLSVTGTAKANHRCSISSYEAVKSKLVSKKLLEKIWRQCCRNHFINLFALIEVFI